MLSCCWHKKRRYDADMPMHYGEPQPPFEHQTWPHNENSNRGQYKDLQQFPPQSNHKVTITKFTSEPQPLPSNPSMFNNIGPASNSSTRDNSHPPMSGVFTYEELVLATNGFADSNLLGQGGFSYVHKGVLSNGKEIAVKQLKSGEGEREFQTEVDIVSRLHHEHLVSLVGYCVSGGRRLLVYEFFPNDTLGFQLHGKGRPTMQWPARIKIALGVAKGLAYVHEDCHPMIIHRGIKPSNILLDNNFEAKVADFRYAKFTSDDNIEVSTRVIGTFGYIAPEYVSSGKLTRKCDVYSFGVILLELITRRRPVDPSHMEDSLVDWARPLLLLALEEGNYEQLVDPRLGNNLNPNEMARMVACAAACVRHSAKRRPRMSQVVRALERDVLVEDLNKGIKPGQGQFFGSYNNSNYDSSHYNEDMKKFRNMELQSNEYQSGNHYSAPTSEYAQNPSGSSIETYTHEMEKGKMMKNKGAYQFVSEGPEGY